MEGQAMTFITDNCRLQKHIFSFFQNTQESYDDNGDDVCPSQTTKKDTVNVERFDCEHKTRTTVVVKTVAMEHSCNAAYRARFMEEGEIQTSPRDSTERLFSEHLHTAADTCPLALRELRVSGESDLPTKINVQAVSVDDVEATVTKTFTDKAEQREAEILSKRLKRRQETIQRQLLRLKQSSKHSAAVDGLQEELDQVSQQLRNVNEKGGSVPGVVGEATQDDRPILEGCDIVPRSQQYLPASKRRKLPSLSPTPSGSNTETPQPEHQKIIFKDDSNELDYQKRIYAWYETATGHPPPAESDLETDSVIREVLTREPRHELFDGLYIPEAVWKDLYPHQQEAVCFLWRLHLQRTGALIGDDMGLGKTIEVLAFLAALHFMSVTTTSSKESSFEDFLPSECQRWYPPFRCMFLSSRSAGTNRRRLARYAARLGSVLIASYESVRADIEFLSRLNWSYVILDEGQKIRNPEAAITVAVKRFKTVHRIILSGSPIQNDLKELWSLFDFLCPGRLGTLEAFITHFADPIRLGGLASASRAASLTAYNCASALRALILPHFLRRNKQEVQLRLPPKSEQILFCRLSPIQYILYMDFLEAQGLLVQPKSHALAEKTFPPRGSQSYSGLRSPSPSSLKIFFALSVLRKICNHPDLLLLDQAPDRLPDDYGASQRSGKVTVALQILEAWKAENHRVLLFSQTIQLLNILEPHLRDAEYIYRRIDGRLSVPTRRRILEEFNTDSSIFLLLLTARVGGVGLNLVAANRIIIFDPDWNPMTDVQARERSWRIGQTKDVMIYRLVSTGTIEEKIYHRQIFKQFLSKKILEDPRQRRFFKWNDLRELFESPPRPDDEDLETLPDGYRALVKRVMGNMCKEDDNLSLHITEKAKLEQEILARDGFILDDDVLRTSDEREGSTPLSLSGDTSRVIQNEDVAETTEDDVPAIPRRRQRLSHTEAVGTTTTITTGKKGCHKPRHSRYIETEITGIQSLGIRTDNTTMLTETSKAEQNRILDTLLSSGGIQGSVSHDFFEMSHPDFDLEQRDAVEKAAAALQAIGAQLPSSAERAFQPNISEETQRNVSVLQLLRQRAAAQEEKPKEDNKTEDITVWAERVSKDIQEMFDNDPSAAFSSDVLISKFKSAVGTDTTRTLEFRRILHRMCELDTELRVWKLRNSTVNPQN